MRIEDTDAVFPVRPVIKATPAQHKQSLISGGVKVKRVVPLEDGIIEIRVDKKGVQMTTERIDQEKVKRIEGCIRGRVGQVLQ